MADRESLLEEWIKPLSGKASNSQRSPLRAFVAPLSSLCAGKTDVLNGAFAGLAAITAGSGFVPPWSAIIIGAVGGVVSFYTVTLFKERECP